MRPLKLTISAWGSYPDKEFIDFERFGTGSLFLITGPTGAGKTTIFDAVSFALFGDISGSVREKGSVRSDFAKPDADTYVELIFSHKGDIYRIRRSPKYQRPKKRGEGFTVSNETGEFYIENEAPIASLNDVNKKVEELLGINYLQFKQIVMIAQGEFMELLISSSKDRTEVLRNLFQTSKYDKIQKSLTDRSKKIYIKIAEINNRISEALNIIEAGENKDLEIILSENDYFGERNYENLREHLKSDEQEIKRLRCLYEAIDSEKNKSLSELMEKQAVNKLFENLNNAVKDKELLIKRKNEIASEEKQVKLLEKAKLAALEEGIYKNILERKRQLSEKVEKLRIENEYLETSYKEAGEKVKINESLRKELNQYLEEKKLLEKVEPVIVEIEEKSTKYNRLEKMFDDTKSRGNKANINIKNVRDNINGIKTDLKELKDSDNKYSEARICLADKNRELDGVLDLIIKRKVLLEQEKIFSGIQAEYTKVEQERKLKKGLYEEKEELYRAAAIGLAAGYLKDNEPCPVCGSLSHPNPAVVSEKVPKEEELEQCKMSYLEVEERYNEAYRRGAAKRGEIDSLRSEFERLCKEINIKELEFESVKEKILGEKEDLEKEVLKYKGCIELREKLNVSLISEENKLEKLMSESEECTAFLTKVRSEKDVLSGIIKALKEQIPSLMLLEDKVTLKNRILKLGVNISNIEKIIEETENTFLSLKMSFDKSNFIINDNEKQLLQLNEEVDISYNTFNLKIIEGGFLSIEEYEDIIYRKDNIEKSRDIISKYYEELRDLIKEIERLEIETENKEYSDISLIEKKFEELEENQKNMTEDIQKLLSRINTNKRALSSIKQRQQERKVLEKEYGIIKDLDNIAKGNNREKIVLEQYVLGVYFEDILNSANLRMNIMTGGRYELLKVDRVVDGRRKESLDIEVLDNYTGKKRSVKTFSGGEAFKAALSLALGLSDVVQRNAGGIEIDTLFIDEGFGSLDQESMNQALNTLNSLTNNHKLIGIISHVSELKDRIENQIVVEKGVYGSKVKLL